MRRKGEKTVTLYSITYYQITKCETEPAMVQTRHELVTNLSKCAIMQV
jgi:hypothetical protein